MWLKKLPMLHDVKFMLSQNKGPSNMHPEQSRGRIQSLAFKTIRSPWAFCQLHISFILPFCLIIKPFPILKHFAGDSVDCPTGQMGCLTLSPKPIYVFTAPECRRGQQLCSHVPAHCAAVLHSTCPQPSQESSWQFTTELTMGSG